MGCPKVKHSPTCDRPGLQRMMGSYKALLYFKEKQMKTILALALVLSLTACGQVDRLTAKIVGGATEICHAGVVYLQFTSGATVKYTPDGKIATCK